MTTNKNEKSEADQIGELNENLTHLHSKVSPDMKNTISKYATLTKRTTSAAVFHLLETHPAIVELKETGLVQS